MNVKPWIKSNDDTVYETCKVCCNSHLICIRLEGQKNMFDGVNLNTLPESRLFYILLPREI